jgi:hypothetical protein
MAEVSKSHLADIAARASARLRSIREEQKVSIDRAMAVVEIWGTSFALGWFHGRKGFMPTLFGIPYDALGAGLAYVVAFSGAAKGAEDHVMNIGHGAGAYYAGNLGAQLGQKMRKETPDWRGGIAYTEDEAKKLGGQVRTIVSGLPQNTHQPYYGGRPQSQPVGLHY